MSAPPEVFFHAGAGRAGSRWLQEAAFPHFRGIRYVPRTRFRASARIISRGGDRSVLVSRQLGYREIERDSAWLASVAPEARPILVVRRHDEWLRSVYLREIKELRPVPFERFIDLERDEGVRPQSSARFRRRIRVLESHFGRPPLVLFFQDLRRDPPAFARILARYVGATLDEGAVSARPVNPSYGERQYRFLRVVGRAWLARRGSSGNVGPQRSPRAGSSGARWVRVRARRLAWHAGVAAGRFVPERWLSSEPLVTPEQLARARAFYEEDWEACRDYARRHNPAHLAHQQGVNG